MRLPTQQHTDRGRLDVKMTPMIDVVFLLLIFFVCTASFQIIEETLPTRLSAPGAVETDQIPEEDLDREEVVVKILPRTGGPQDSGPRAGGAVTWIVGEQACVSLADVENRFRALAGIDLNLPIILDVDGRVHLGHVVAVWDLCRLAGFDRIQFSVPAGE